MTRRELMTSTMFYRSPDEPVGGAAQPELALAPAAAPVVEPVAPASAPAPDATPAPADAPKPADAAPVPKPEDKPAESLLASAKADADKPAEGAKPADAPKPAEGDAAAKPPEPAPVVEPAKIEYQPFTLPENVTVDPEAMTKFTETIGKFGLPQEGGQALVEMHQAELTKHINKLHEDGWRAFHDTGKKWLEDTYASREFSGNGRDTAVATVAAMRDRYVSRFAPGTPEYASDWKAWTDLDRATNIGNHPALLRLLYNMGQERAAPTPVDGAKPPADRGPAPRGRRSTMYDHPASAKKA